MTAADAREVRGGGSRPEGEPASAADRPDPNLPGPETGWTASFGGGDPVTLFAHGFSGQIRDTRPFASGIAGTRTLVNLGGHGGRPSPGPGWTYETIAGQLAAALRDTGATRALGVSMSAGGLARLVTSGDEAACALEKIAFVLPASWAGFDAEAASRIEEMLAEMRALLAAGDRDGLVAWMLDREPPEVAALAPARAWAEKKAENLLTTPMRDGVGLAARVAVESPERAADFAGEVLVLTHEDDPSHPVEVAEEYATAFPQAELVVLPPGSILWRGRAEVRRVLREFFDG